MKFLHAYLYINLHTHILFGTLIILNNIFKTIVIHLSIKNTFFNKEKNKY